MSILRTALKAPARSFGVRYASSALVNVSPETQKTLDSVRIKDPRIPEGVQAFSLLVPKDIPETDFSKRRASVEAHSVQTTDLWRKISYYVCIPGVIVAAIYVYNLEAEHEEHLQHLIDANGGVPPERKTYSYMNMRTKQFPWGNNSLFYNPRYNIPVQEQ